MIWRQDLSIRNFIEREREVCSGTPDEISEDTKSTESDYKRSIETWKENMENCEIDSDGEDLDECERRRKNEIELKQNYHQFVKEVNEMRENLLDEPSAGWLCLVMLGCDC